MTSAYIYTEPRGNYFDPGKVARGRVSSPYFPGEIDRSRSPFLSPTPRQSFPRLGRARARLPLAIFSLIVCFFPGGARGAGMENTVIARGAAEVKIARAHCGRVV